MPLMLCDLGRGWKCFLLEFGLFILAELGRSLFWAGNTYMLRVDRVGFPLAADWGGGLGF